MRRREFISFLGGAAVAWPFVARARERSSKKRVGVLMNLAAEDPVGQSRLAAFLQALRQLGWTDGDNIQIDVRWPGSDRERARKYATELVALSPDVILAVTSLMVAAVQQATRNVPIVFVTVVDPVGAGMVASLARPGGNTTGFIAFEYALAAKWLQLLKEIAPRVTRAAVLRDSSVAAGIGQFAAIQTVGSVGMELTAIEVRDADEIEHGVASFARGQNGGLIVTASQFGGNHPDIVTASAERHKLPAVYPFRYYVTAGGLISYGPETLNDYRQAASYVDRILKGETPADLPVQAPTKYELVINLKTAKALGLTVPDKLISTADEVIE
jgi:putative tryptophan/tyrosine transport system substrate-binding protein